MERVMDPMDEVALMDKAQSESDELERDVVGNCDPVCECLDPGRGMIDDPAGDDGWVEPGPAPEESFARKTDELVSDIDAGWEDELLDL